MTLSRRLRWWLVDWLRDREFRETWDLHNGLRFYIGPFTIRVPK